MISELIKKFFQSRSKSFPVFLSYFKSSQKLLMSHQKFKKKGKIKLRKRMEDNTEAPRNQNQTPKIYVLFPTGNRMEYSITKMTTVSDLINMINQDEKVEVPANRVIALIYHGRILQPTEVISKIDTLDEFTIHVFYRQAQQQATNRDEHLESDLRGFDRLSRMNYTAEQIAELRQNFHVMHGTLNATQEARMDAEEEWFPIIFNDENPMPTLQINQVDARRFRRSNRHGSRNNDNSNNENNNATNENNHNANDDAWLVHDDAMEGSSWMRFALGFIIGIIFGIGSILFALTSLTDSSMLAGLFLGTVIHYCIEFSSN